MDSVYIIYCVMLKRIELFKFFSVKIDKYSVFALAGICRSHIFSLFFVICCCCVFLGLVVWFGLFLMFFIGRDYIVFCCVCFVFFLLSIVFFYCCRTSLRVFESNWFCCGKVCFDLKQPFLYNNWKCICVDRAIMQVFVNF